MAASFNDIVKQGYVRVRSRKLGLWQRRWIILHRASSKGPNRLEKFIDEHASRHGHASKLMILSDVANISRLPNGQKRHALCIHFSDDARKELCCESDLEADDWVKALWQECLGRRPGIADGEPDVLGPGVQKELKERFHVYLLPTSSLDFYGECMLQVTHENVHLWDVHNHRTRLVSWPLTALRRYGRDAAKFTFEAGRHCSTGEGMFVFNTVEGDEIYHKVHQATLAIAEAHLKMMARKAQQRAQQQQVALQRNSLIDHRTGPSLSFLPATTVAVPSSCPTSPSHHDYVNIGEYLLNGTGTGMSTAHSSSSFATALDLQMQAQGFGRAPPCRLTDHLLSTQNHRDSTISGNGNGNS